MLSLSSSYFLLKSLNLMLLSFISCVNQPKHMLVSEIPFLPILKSLSSSSLTNFIDMLGSIIFQVFISASIALFLDLVQIIF